MNKALEVLASLAYNGSEVAATALMEMYYDGDGVPEDLKKAEEFASMCSTWSDSDEEMGMMWSFAEMYRYGTNGAEKNMAKAVKWYEQLSCFDSDEDLILTLAQIYIDGDGVPQNGKRAVELLTEIAFPEYSFYRGKIYFDGRDFPMFDSERNYFFSDSDNWGSDKARYKLACMYLYGTAVEKDIYKAAWWFAKIDELDFYDDGEIFKIAELYRKGNGVKKDISKAIAWYERLLEYDYNDEVMYMIGECYYDESYSERDIFDAIEWYEKSADKGNVKAMYRLAGIYFYGEDVEINLSKALEWIDKISENLKQPK